MNKTMKAAVVRAFGKPLTIDEVPVPEPGPGMIQVRIQASGVCHTDLHAAEGDWPVKPSLPFIPGHEGVGHVAAVGAGVTRVKEGDRVGVPWLYTACGCCEHCLTGWETLCEGQQNTGYSVNGGYAEYVLADPNYVGILPKNVEFDEIAPILCAGVTVYKGLKVTVEPAKATEEDEQKALDALRSRFGSLKDVDRPAAKDDFVTMDLTASVDGEQVSLPLKEFELLEMLLRNAGRVLTRGQLIDRVWGSDYVGDTKTLDVHVKRLRSKIEPDPSSPRHLVTVRGLGYKFEA